MTNIETLGEIHYVRAKMARLVREATGSTHSGF